MLRSDANSGPEPRLSIVVTCRNDDHGVGLLKRMQIFVTCLSVLCRKYRLPAELVIVEWNPLPDRPSLSEVLEFDTAGPLVFRFIEVPAEIHNRFRNSDKIAVFQMLAKNVGIRRARAPFILSTNIDLIFSEELVEFLAGELDPNAMYRIDRLDVPADIPDRSVEEQLQWCSSNILRRNSAKGTIDYTAAGFKWGGWRKSIGRIVNAVRMLDPNNTRVAHTNASGDFTLLHRDAWEKTRGYMELPLFCLHLDGVLCLMAVGLGFRQVALKDPLRTYHIDHGGSWAAMTFEDRLHFFETKPWLDYSFVREINNRVARGRVPEVFNSGDWGLINEDLSETILEPEIAPR